jgi:acyl-CoA synthetase (AMP-forming)/AMP-acid ligase II
MFYWEIATTAAQARPDELAIIAPNGRRTWRELVQNVHRVAGMLALERNLARGARVGVLLRNGAWQPELYYGISRAGGVVVPLNWRLTAAELGRVIVDAGIELVFIGEDLVDQITGTSVETIVCRDAGDGASGYGALLRSAPVLHEDPAGLTADDLAMIAYTSGTTGDPKGVMHTHASLIQSVLRLSIEMRLRPRDVFFSCLPMFFGAGAHSAMSAPLFRGCTLIVDDFSPKTFLDAVERFAVSATLMVPTMITQVMDYLEGQESSLGSMRNWCYAGAALPVPEMERALARFGPLFSGYYGQLESGLLGSSFLSEDHVGGDGSQPRLRSIGQPTIGTSLRVVDVDTGEDVPRDGRSHGEIWIRTPSVMKGYLDEPGLTGERLTSAGWLRTGDVAVYDTAGFLYLVDRLTDMIITGGINVFPTEVEKVIASHPDVHSVVVLGLPSLEWGEEITACVIRRGERDLGVLQEEILDVCDQQLAGYKKPRRVVFRDELPMTGSGKVMKAALREALNAEGQAPREARPGQKSGP